ncbi:MAG: hypothetical protein DI551_01585 [Micavibrio aeruginosavorus]|uniref:Uncharacterized protein n=1 Tax=Micavibrio aeruginosavorus TaxID=349221 RepID=A0A2W5QAN3_9BACT|nr:MAG: hypothetical protein DI551_01585 [Micavibrio aeruginosavorus]
MITILIGLFDKKTKFVAEEKKVEFPNDMVFRAVERDEYTGDEFSVACSEGKGIDYINCRPFALTDEMIAYANENYPELKEKFDLYHSEFIGRHGLGPEYD